MTEPAVAKAERVGTFEDFFRAHYERLLRTMYLTTGDRHEAEDLAQDAMARVYERWDRVSGTEDPVGYVYRVALNARRSRLRRISLAARKAFRSGPAATRWKRSRSRTPYGKPFARSRPDNARRSSSSGGSR